MGISLSNGKKYAFIEQLAKWPAFAFHNLMLVSVHGVLCVAPALHHHIPEQGTLATRQFAEAIKRWETTQSFCLWCIGNNPLMETQYADHNGDKTPCHFCTFEAVSEQVPIILGGFRMVK